MFFRYLSWITVYTTQRILEHLNESEKRSDSCKINDSIIIEPCFIGNNGEVHNSIVGPHVSIGNNTVIKDSIIKNSIIKEDTDICQLNAVNSIIGSNSNIKGEIKELSLADHTSII